MDCRGRWCREKVRSRGLPHLDLPHLGACTSSLASIVPLLLVWAQLCWLLDKYVIGGGTASVDLFFVVLGQNILDTKDTKRERQPSALPRVPLRTYYTLYAHIITILHHSCLLIMPLLKKESRKKKKKKKRWWAALARRDCLSKCRCHYSSAALGCQGQNTRGPHTAVRVVLIRPWH